MGKKVVVIGAGPGGIMPPAKPRNVDITSHF